MQFDSITEKCIQNPMEVRKLPEKEKQEMLSFLRDFRIKPFREDKGCPATITNALNVGT